MPVPTVEVDIELYGLDLAERFTSFEAFYADLRRVHGGDEALTVNYERRVENEPDVGFELVVEFLGLDPFEPTITQKRVNRRRLVDVLENFDQVAWALTGTEFEWMLNG